MTVQEKKKRNKLVKQYKKEGWNNQVAFYRANERIDFERNCDRLKPEKNSTHNAVYEL